MKRLNRRNKFKQYDELRSIEWVSSGAVHIKDISPIKANQPENIPFDHLNSIIREALNKGAKEFYRTLSLGSVIKYVVINERP